MITREEFISTLDARDARLDQKLNERFQEFEDRFEAKIDRKLDQLDTKWEAKFVILDNRIDELARIMKRGFDEIMTICVEMRNILNRHDEKLYDHEYTIYKNHEPRIKDLEQEL